MKTRPIVSPTAPPWTLDGDRILGYTVRDANDCLLAEEHSIPESQARLIAAAPDLLAVAEMVRPHGDKLREKAKWLQTWLHETPEGKALPEVARSSFGQLIAELQQLATGSRLPQAARVAIAKATAP